MRPDRVDTRRAVRRALSQRLGHALGAPLQAVDTVTQFAWSYGLIEVPHGPAASNLDERGAPVDRQGVPLPCMR